MKVNLYRNIDKIIGSILCGLLGVLPLHKRIYAEKLNSILVIKLWAIGESVLTLPMINAIKTKYPRAKITVLARKRNKDVYAGQKCIDKVMLFEPEKFVEIAMLFKKFDLAIDCEPYLNVSAIAGRLLARKQIGFSHGIRAKMYDEKVVYNDQQHVVKTYLDLAKIIRAEKEQTALIKLTHSNADKQAVSEMLNESGVKKEDLVIGICASVAESGKSRMWPNENYAELIDWLIKEKKAKVILIGGKNDAAHNKVITQFCKNKKSIINAAGKASLKQLFALVEKCKLFISNDTGPMHIAAAQGTRTIGIFGPNLPTRFAPYGKKNISLYAKQYCSPCINVHKGSFPKCYNAVKGKCLKEIKPAMVEAAVDKCLKR